MIYVINGPNLNLLGHRDKKIYGDETLDTINERLCIAARKEGVDLDFFQSNHEGEIVDKIGNVLNDGRIRGIIINPAALSHYSIALRDALEMISGKGIPIVEVHLSNIHAREDFRHKSLISPVSKGVIAGFGGSGYEMALNYISKLERNLPSGCKTGSEGENE